MKDDPYKPSPPELDLVEEGKQVGRANYFGRWSFGVLVIPLLGSYPCFFLIGD